MVVRRASHLICFLLSAIHLSTVTPRNVGSLPDALVSCFNIAILQVDVNGMTPANCDIHDETK